MSEPITHIDMDNCMTIHHKGTSYFDSTAHLFTPLKEMISYRKTHLQPEWQIHVAIYKQ